MRNLQSLLSFFPFLSKPVTYWLVFPSLCHPARPAHIVLSLVLQQRKGGLKIHQHSQKAFSSAAQSRSAWTALSLINSLCALIASSTGHGCP